MKKFVRIPINGRLRAMLDEAQRLDFIENGLTFDYEVHLSVAAEHGLAQSLARRHKNPDAWLTDGDGYWVPGAVLAERMLRGSFATEGAS